MQSLGWYARRLKTMSLPEIVWRMGGVVRDSTDRVLAGSRKRPLEPSRCLNGDRASGLIPEAALGSHLAGAELPWLADVPAAWRLEAIARADAVAEHRLSFFDLGDVDLGRPIDWNHEFKAGKATPRVFAGDIDYRDYAVTGDCKFAWEPSRHHQFVTLGRAYRYTGDERYAESLLEQMESWIEQCPFGFGMQWRSPLELGIRLINWVWALELIRPSAALSSARLERIAACAYRHLWDISRKYSRFSSANNHLIGEAAGVYIGSSYFRGLKGASRRRAESREILHREISSQTFADGGNREQALGYHLFVLQFFLLSGIVARNTGEDFDPQYWSQLERMFDYASAFMDGDEVSPMYGDSDDGYVLDLGRQLGDARGLMAIGAVLFQRGDFKSLAGGRAVGGERREPAYWLLGPESAAVFDRLEAREAGWESQARPESGYYILRRGSRDAEDRVSVVFDCGPLGFGSIAAHGHADALSMTMRLGGCDILVDPGTYDYFTFEAWRRYFRGTRAHNTVTVDEADQSELLGSFLWGRRAEARCLKWAPSEDGGLVIGEHNGYHRLSEPVTHRRTVRVHGDRPEISVTDDLLSAGRHDVTMRWHLGERCQVAPRSAAERGEHEFEVDYGIGRAVVELDRAMTVATVTGSEDPIMGWVSRGYHGRVATTVLVGRCRAEGNLTLCTRIKLGGEGATPRGLGGRYRGGRRRATIEGAE